MSTPLFHQHEGSAEVSTCRLFRYELIRSWAPAAGRVAFLMLNPSTADASNNDSTVRKCMGFARSWGFGELAVYNLFALRSPDPDDVLRAADAQGENDKYLVRLAGLPVICAWGQFRWAKPRAVEVLDRFITSQVSAVAVNQDGSPRHPLYVPGSAQPQPWSPEGWT